MMARTSTALTLLLAVTTSAAYAAQALDTPCAGDCDGSEKVTIAELIRGVGIALERFPTDTCSNLDLDNSGDVSIAELIAAVNRALRGCFFGELTVDRSDLCFAGQVGADLPDQTVRVLRSAGRWVAQTSAAWLLVEPTQGEARASLQVSVATADIPDGSLGGEIRLSDGSGAPQTIAVDLSLRATAIAPGWHTQTVSSVGPRGEQTALALDPAGRPGITFFRNDEETNVELWFALWQGCRWSTEVIERGVTSALAFDHSGRPHVAFNSNPLLALRYATREENGWNIVTVDEARTGAAGFRPSLVLDADGLPHVSYQIKAGLFDLRYAFFDGTQWSVETVDAEGSTGWNSSLQLSPADEPRISYHTDPSALNYAERDGAGWTIEQLGGGGIPTSLGLDAAGLPLLAHRGQGINKRIWLMRRDENGKWQSEEVATVGHQQRRCVSLALDSSQQPHIAYNDPASGTLNYASPTSGGDWLIEVIDQDPEGDLGDHCSLQIDGADVAHISYVDLPLGVLKYARGTAVPLD